MEKNKIITTNTVEDFDNEEAILKNSKEFFEKNNIETYRIKNWTIEKGEKLHPLLKYSPAVNIGILLKDVIEPFESEINDIFKNKDGKYPEIEIFKIDDGIITAKEFDLRIINNNIYDYIKKGISEKLSSSGINISVLEMKLIIYKKTNDNLGKKGMHATNWHLDDARADIRLIIYLDDVNDELDGPFEVCNNPELNAYELKELSYKGIHIYDTLMEKEGKIPNENENGIKFFGPKYTTAMFYSSILHRANRPIRKDRPFLFIFLNIEENK
jgi:hypothetical protein